MPDSSFSALPDVSEDDALEYRPVEAWAIVALLLGLASPLALVDPLLSLVPVIGLLAALVALSRISGDPLRPGRRAALAGMALSALFLMVPLAHYTSANWLLARQARPVADEFVKDLRERNPQQALLLTMVPDRRPPNDDGLWSFYRNDAESQQDLRMFVDKPAIRMLLALGDRADIRFYKTNKVAAGRTVGLVDYWYTVTFVDDDGRKKTIMFGLLMERKQPQDRSLNPWRVKDFTTDFNREHRA